MEFVIGMFVGALMFYLFVDRKKSSGDLIIDCSDPMNENLVTLDLHQTLDTIWNKKTILLKVKTYSNSQE